MNGVDAVFVAVPVPNLPDPEDPTVPPVAVNDITLSTQTEAAPGVIVKAVGYGDTVTATVAAAVVHPFSSTPVTEYVVLALGEALTLALVVPFKPKAGVHV